VSDLVLFSAEQIVGRRDPVTFAERPRLAQELGFDFCRCRLATGTLRRALGAAVLFEEIAEAQAERGRDALGVAAGEAFQEHAPVRARRDRQRRAAVIVRRAARYPAPRATARADALRERLGRHENSASSCASTTSA
jgi:hypothetical protein